MPFIVTDQGDGITNVFRVPIGPTGRTAKVAGSTVAITAESPYGFVQLASVPAAGALVEITCPDVNRGAAAVADWTTMVNKPTTVAGFGITDIGWPLSKIKEAAVVGTVPGAVQPINLGQSQVTYFPSAATNNFVPNLRISTSSPALPSAAATNDVFTATIAVTNGATPYYCTGLQIDGSAVTPKWFGGSAPVAGNANSVDVYTFACRWTGSAWDVLASLATAR